MEDLVSFVGYDLAIGLTTGVGVLYFMFLRPSAVEYRRFLVVTIAGSLLFLVGGPVVELVVPSLVHWVHGVAAALVLVGLYEPLGGDVGRGGWTDVLVRDPDQIRQPADWMVPIDDAILGVFHETDLVLSPSIIAHNIEYSRGEVNRRLVELDERGFVTRVERGKYRITARGRSYVDGPDPRSIRTHLRSVLPASNGPE